VKPGDRVVVEGGVGLEDGAKVSLGSAEKGEAGEKGEKEKAGKDE